MPEATDRVVVDSLFIPAPVVCGALVFDPVLGVHSGFIIASLGKSELFALLCLLDFMWSVSDLCLFLAVPWVDLQYLHFKSELQYNIT